MPVSEKKRTVNTGKKILVIERNDFSELNLTCVCFSQSILLEADP